MAGSYSEKTKKYELARTLENCNEILESVLDIARDLEDVGTTKEAHIEEKKTAYWNFFGEKAIEVYGKSNELDSPSQYLDEERNRFEKIIQEARKYNSLADDPSVDTETVQEYRNNKSKRKLF